MKRILVAVAGMAAIGCGVAPASFAYPGQGVPNPRYPDGTGDGAVDQLNAAQLNENYRGPVYQGGPPPGGPHFRPPPPPPGHDHRDRGEHGRHHRHHPMPPPPPPHG